MELQLFVTNLAGTAFFFLALDFRKVQYKIDLLFSVCQDAAAQPANAALLSNSKGGK